MKTVELPGGMPVFLSLQENQIYSNLVQETCKSDLSERDAYIAQSLVNKGVVKRVIRDGKTYYSRSKGSLS
jgi:hypothetical protein